MDAVPVILNQTSTSTNDLQYLTATELLESIVSGCFIESATAQDQDPSYQRWATQIREQDYQAREKRRAWEAEQLERARIWEKHEEPDGVSEARTAIKSTIRTCQKSFQVQQWK